MLLCKLCILWQRSDVLNVAKINLICFNFTGCYYDALVVAIAMNFITMLGLSS